MEGAQTCFLVLTACAVCVCCGGKAEDNGTTATRNRTVHIHKHNGDITSENATSISWEESKYFLKRLFQEYGSGDKMEMAGLEMLLGRVGYYAADAQTEHHNEHEHKAESEHSEYEHEDGSGEHEHEEHEHGEDDHEEHEHGEDDHEEHEHGEDDHEEHEHGEDDHKEEHEHEDENNQLEKNNTIRQDQHKSGEYNSAPKPLSHISKRKKVDLGADKDNGNDKDRKHDFRDVVSEYEHDQEHHNASDANENASERNAGNNGNDNTSGEDSDDLQIVSTEIYKENEYGLEDDSGVHYNKEQGGNNHYRQGKNREDHERNIVVDNKEKEGLEEQFTEGRTDISDRGKDAGRHVDSIDHVTIHHSDGHSEGMDVEDERGEHRKGKQGKKRKRTQTERKNKKPRRPKKKSGRKKVQRDKRSASSVIFHTHDVHSNCLSITELLRIFHFDEKNKISQRDFLYISPAIIYQLNKPRCRRREHSAMHDHKNSNSRRSQVGGISVRVWGYSSAAVVVISLVGLLSVVVIPIMQRFFYSQLLQFLIAMAVGALTGDAMLHLLPHAIAVEVPVEEGGAEHEHSRSVWKGMCGLAGIFFFFILQRLLTIITGVKNRRRRRKKDRMLQKQMSLVGHSLNEKLKNDTNDSADGNISISISAPDPDVINEQLAPLKPKTNARDAKNIDDDDHVGPAHSGHGHSHHDGPMPTSVSAVAWMVILGDGVHNLSDGLAIGAAFASSITGGLSTTIAVFCHELPHEIGDFAVLLKAGMSVKQAVLYNCVSSVLSFIGMLIGVGLGNIHEASLWIFAAIGGMFIYISLVNMIPELTSVESQKPLRDLIVQCIGMCIGSGIMLVIAVYEKDLLTVLG